MPRTMDQPFKSSVSLKFFYPKSFYHPPSPRPSKSHPHLSPALAPPPISAPFQPLPVLRSSRPLSRPPKTCHEQWTSPSNPPSEIFLPKIFLPFPSPQPLKIFHQPQPLTAHLRSFISAFLQSLPVLRSFSEGWTVQKPHHPRSTVHSLHHLQQPPAPSSGPVPQNNRQPPSSTVNNRQLILCPLCTSAPLRQNQTSQRPPISHLIV